MGHFLDEISKIMIAAILIVFLPMWFLQNGAEAKIDATKLAKAEQVRSAGVPAASILSHSYHYCDQLGGTKIANPLKQTVFGEVSTGYRCSVQFTDEQYIQLVHLGKNFNEVFGQ